MRGADLEENAFLLVCLIEGISAGARHATTLEGGEQQASDLNHLSVAAEVMLDRERHK